MCKDGDKGKYLTIAGTAGTLVPCRDIEGNIVALKVRRDGEKEELKSKGQSRYSYLSSSHRKGPSALHCVHTPLGVGNRVETVRVTEGELKADIATALSDTPTISVPGVASWKAAIPILRQLGTKSVVISFDADARENPTVARCLVACVDGLSAEGFSVAVEKWDALHKGIDDALKAGAALDVGRRRCPRLHRGGVGQCNGRRATAAAESARPSRRSAENRRRRGTFPRRGAAEEPWPD